MDEEKIIADNMGLVYMTLHKFNRVTDDEAYSYAVEALMKAARTYDASKNVQFSTYATSCIYNAVACYLRTMHNKQKNFTVVSYDDLVPGFEDASFHEVVPSDEPTPDDVYLRKELHAEIYTAFKNVVNAPSASKTLRDVANYWARSNFTATQADIAAALNISQPTVSRALSVLKYRLRLELEGYMMT